MIQDLDEEDFNDLYQSVVLQNSKNPRNFKKLDCGFCSKGKNPSCGDELEIYMNFDGVLLKEISFQGKGCALSVSSASLLTEKLKNKKLEEIKKILNLFSIYILSQKTEVDLNDDEKNQLNELGNLAIFKGVKKYPLRVKCVMLSFRTVEQIIKDWEADNHGE